MKKRISTFICMFIAVAMLLCSCKNVSVKPDDEEDKVYEDVGVAQTVQISLPYSASDSLNPFFAQGAENLALAYLYCQPLFEVKSDYSAEPVLAESSKLESNTATVTLRNALFSDGASVTARDVVYSFNMAKQSGAFSQRLKNVVSASAVGSSVVFSLEAPDRLYENILTFPIVKNGTAQTPESIPTGSGRFAFDGDRTLALNKYSEVISQINKVSLVNVKKLEYITNAVEIGNINYLFEDFSEGSYKRIVAQNKSVTLNNIVYLGINKSVPALSSSAIRTAVYYALDKQTVCSSAYQGYAKAAVTPFNPDFCMLEGLELPSVNGNSAKCDSILSKMGYNYYTKNGVRTDQTNTLSFSLLVNSENTFRVLAAEKTAQQLNSAGFSVSVEKVDNATYQQRIATGNYQLYIGEIKLTENFDLSVFFSESSLATEYQSFKSMQTDVKAFIDAFYNEMPFVPICYRMGMAAYSKGYSPDFTYAPFDIYGNIENWEKQAD